MKRADFIRY